MIMQHFVGTGDVCVCSVMAARQIQLGFGSDQGSTGSLQNKAVGELRCLSCFASVATASVSRGG